MSHAAIDDGASSIRAVLTRADEAALYDRQIRLWGATSQIRMRNASILMVRLRGLGCEVCKNIVLAGIGKLTIADDADLSAADLESGYFYRAEEIGRKRVESAAPRIQALNPRVELSTRTDLSILNDAEALKAFDLVCATDSDPATLVRVNDLCRAAGIKFYGAASIGLSGYVFSDLVSHEYTLKRTDASKRPVDGEQAQITEQRRQDFVSLTTALQHSWKGVRIRPKQLPRMLALFEMLGVLRYQSENNGALPSSVDTYRDAVERLLREKAIDPSVLQQDRLEFIARTAHADFAPSCAVVGGILGQDILNAVGGSELPIMNFLAFDGDTSASPKLRRMLIPFETLLISIRYPSRSANDLFYSRSVFAPCHTTMSLHVVSYICPSGNSHTHPSNETNVKALDGRIYRVDSTELASLIQREPDAVQHDEATNSYVQLTRSNDLRVLVSTFKDQNGRRNETPREPTTIGPMLARSHGRIVDASDPRSLATLLPEWDTPDYVELVALDGHRYTIDFEALVQLEMLEPDTFDAQGRQVKPSRRLLRYIVDWTHPDGETRNSPVQTDLISG